MSAIVQNRERYRMDDVICRCYCVPFYWCVNALHVHALMCTYLCFWPLSANFYLFRSHVRSSARILKLCPPLQSSDGTSSPVAKLSKWRDVSLSISSKVIFFLRTCLCRLRILIPMVATIICVFLFCSLVCLFSITFLYLFQI